MTERTPSKPGIQVPPGVRDFRLQPGFIWAEPTDNMRTRIPSFERPLLTFKQNVARIIALDSLPAEIAMWVCVSERVEAIAQVTMAPTLGKDEEQFNRAVETEVAKQMAQVRFELEEMYRTNVLTSRIKNLIDRAYLNVQKIGGYTPNNSEALDAWFAAHVTGFWTAFELFSGDLWEAALNVHPKGLAEMRGRSDNKTVPAMWFQKHGYDLSAMMGTLWKDKQNFSRLDGIKEAYRVAFHEGRTEIDKALNDKSVLILSQTRNVIVHSGSKIDEEYLRVVGSIEGAQTGAVGDQLNLDGDIIVQLLMPVAEQCNALLAAVEKWITDH